MRTKLLTKVCAVVLAIMTMVSCFAMTSSAQTGFFIGSNSYSYNDNTYCTCTLKKPGKKDAKVTVSLTSTSANLSIKMTDGSGRTLWVEDNSIKYTLSRSRTYKLGKNHSKYRLYFKATNGKGSGFVSVKNPKNCTIA